MMLCGFRFGDLYTSYHRVYYYLYGHGGNVEGILDAGGNLLVRYTYDAWGNFIETINTTDPGALAALAMNPFRYRGYVYDTETELYYLQSRYYDPQTGRFISADNAGVVIASGMTLTDKNLFAYCDNDPVNRTDETGEFWILIGAAVGAVVGGVVAALNGEDTAGIIIGVLSGAASGVVAATGLGLVAQAAVSAGISAVADIANQAVDIVQDGGLFCL